MVDGVLAIAVGVRNTTHHGRWGWLVLEGVANLLAGAVALLLPGPTIVVAVLLFGLWSLVTGIVMVVTALHTRALPGRLWPGLNGLLSAVWGVLLYASPVAGALVLTWWLGGYALVFGILMLVAGFCLRGHA